MSEILAYAGYGALVVLAIFWTIGVRVKLTASAPTIFGALIFVVGAIVIPVLGINKLHSFWVILVGYTCPILIAHIVPYKMLFFPFHMVASLFSYIIRIGIPRHKIKTAQQMEILETMRGVSERAESAKEE